VDDSEAGVAHNPESSDTTRVPEALERECEVCGKTFREWAVSPCPICKKIVCHKCAHLAFARSFCSQACAEFFFHGEDDEEDEHD